MPRTVSDKARRTPKDRVTVIYGEDLFESIAAAQEDRGFVSTSEFLRFIAREWLKENNYPVG